MIFSTPQPNFTSIHRLQHQRDGGDLFIYLVIVVIVLLLGGGGLYGRGRWY